MSRIWCVIKREYLENVRTKAFLIGLVLTPIWMGLIFVVPALAGSAEVKAVEVVIVDETGVLLGPLTQDLERYESYEIRTLDPETAWDEDDYGISEIDALELRAGAGELFAVILTTPLLEKREPGPDERAYRILGPSGLSARAEVAPRLSAAVDRVVNAHIIDQRDIDEEDAKLLQRRGIEYVPLDAEGEAASDVSMVTPIMFMMLLFMGIVGISQMLISSTLEEKSNRVFEVLLSSLSPFQLMVGKILGICGVGLTLMLLWSGGGLLAAAGAGLDGIVSARQVGWFLVYYFLGFLMISSLMVAVGSACNTLKEAQNLMAPISMLLAMPLLLSIVILRDPNSSLAVGLSFVPPFTPFIMMTRLASVPGPPAWQMWATLLALVLGTYLAFVAAGRVFRVGILLYGQPPKLSQIWRWMSSRD